MADGERADGPVGVLHASWVPDSGLALWGERVGAAPKSPRPSRTRARWHPFALEPSALERVVAALVHLHGSDPERSEATLRTTTIDLWLPVCRGEPLSSPTRLQALGVEPEAPSAADKIELGRLRVPAVFVAPGALAAVLLQAGSICGDVTTRTRRSTARIHLGKTLHYAADLLRIAYECVCAGRFVPALERIGRFWRARWRHERTWFLHDARRATLTRAMPGALRAFADRAGKLEIEQSKKALAPALVLEELLSYFVDAIVRRCLRGVDWLPDLELDDLPHGTWLRALSEADPAPFRHEASRIRPLAERLERWADPARTLNGGVLICFRLHEPEPDEHEPERAPQEQSSGSLIASTRQAWWLEVLLQPETEPGLLVGADQIWELDEVLDEQTPTELHEQLLKGLARAAGCFAPLERALEERCPTGVALSSDEAYRFLREASPKLSAHGFRVLVPRWWSESRRELGLYLRASSATASGVSDSHALGLSALCSFEWQAAIGDQRLSLEELRRLARLKQPLVQIHGQWVELRPERLEQVLAIVEGRNPDNDASKTMSAAKALRYGLGLERPGDDVPVHGVEATGWLAQLFDERNEVRLAAVRTPRGFHGALRPYQLRGLGWLAFLARLGLGGCLADDMGLGKTVQLLALLLAEREPGEERSEDDPIGPPPPAGPTLLVCPMSVLGNWQREAARFAPSLRVHVHHGPTRPKGKRLRQAIAQSDLVVSTYHTVARDVEALSRIRWGRIALDEAQHIKNSRTAQARAIRRFEAPQRVALTGTPIENRLTELWSIMDVLNPGLLGSRRQFERNVAIPIERFRDEQKAALIRRVVRPFVLRRLKTDPKIIEDLPDKFEIKEYCHLTREQASLYQAVVDDMLEGLKRADGMARRGLVLTSLTRLKQVCNHPAHLLGDSSPLAGRSGKLARLEELLEEVFERGERALLFTQYRAFGELLQPYLSERFGFEAPFLHGGSSQRARDRMVERFQQGEGAPLLLLSLRAGGTGLNLTAANHVIHVDRWWNPAVEDQATDRAYRIGQRRDVQVRKLICVGTVEERIDKLIEAKRSLADRIIGAGEAWLTELDTERLRELVTLSAEAVREEEDDVGDEGQR